MNTSESKKTFSEEVKGTASEIISQVKKLIKEGNARRVIIQNKEGKVLFQSQLTVGVAGTAMLTAIAPVVSAISMFALFMNDIKIIVERYPEEEGETQEKKSKDEYEVEAEIIDIKDEEEEKEDTANTKSKTEKTVGKGEEE
ncbi:DUF4342 domain-containing protein [Fodinibius salsisoli]|uniref:DUF4342 domain-containing protein n=1 Tax=Fodinibius salsisoli TaxID=2820877 RepID=A0ABT3PP48_9BACT|nr:DUF4342 domain-containing protein [Fodinibius salsisoli]MCW9707637.1 DUF4342 domain-containing protein [Fodinibius salsisoli]